MSGNGIPESWRGLTDTETLEFERRCSQSMLLKEQLRNASSESQLHAKLSQKFKEEASHLTQAVALAEAKQMEYQQKLGIEDQKDLRNSEGKWQVRIKAQDPVQERT